MSNKKLKKEYRRKYLESLGETEPLFELETPRLTHFFNRIVFLGYTDKIGVGLPLDKAAEWKLNMYKRDCLGSIFKEKS